MYRIKAAVYRIVNHSVWATTLLAGTQGCASGLPTRLADLSHPAETSYEVEVTNRNWDDMRVYVVKGGAMHRLGSIGSGETRSFHVPPGVAGGLGGLRLAARALSGARIHYSELVDIAPGQTVGWSLEPNLKLSFHWVR